MGSCRNIFDDKVVQDIVLKRMHSSLDELFRIAAISRACSEAIRRSFNHCRSLTIYDKDMEIMLDNGRIGQRFDCENALYSRLLMVLRRCPNLETLTVFAHRGYKICATTIPTPSVTLTKLFNVISSQKDQFGLKSISLLGGVTQSFGALQVIEQHREMLKNVAIATGFNNSNKEALCDVITRVSHLQSLTLAHFGSVEPGTLEKMLAGKQVNELRLIATVFPYDDFVRALNGQNKLVILSTAFCYRLDRFAKDIIHSKPTLTEVIWTAFAWPTVYEDITLVFVKLPNLKVIRHMNFDAEPFANLIESYLKRYRNEAVKRTLKLITINAESSVEKQANEDCLFEMVKKELADVKVLHQAGEAKHGMFFHLGNATVALEYDEFSEFFGVK